MAGALMFVTGCQTGGHDTLTGGMWDSDVAFNHSGPAASPNLNLYQVPNQQDFLVMYDEEHDGNETITRRAYLLWANQKRVEEERKPHFLEKPKLDGLQAVSVETNSTAAMSSTNAAALRAVLLADLKHFKLISDGREIGIFRLPTYVNNGDRAWRIAVTPVTVAADVTFYTAATVAVLGAVVLYCYANQNPSGVFH